MESEHASTVTTRLSLPGNQRTFHKAASLSFTPHLTAGWTLSPGVVDWPHPHAFRASSVHNEWHPVAYPVFESVCVRLVLPLSLIVQWFWTSFVSFDTAALNLLLQTHLYTPLFCLLAHLAICMFVVWWLFLLINNRIHKILTPVMKCFYLSSTSSQWG